MRVSSTPTKPIATKKPLKKKKKKAAPSGTELAANVNFTSTNVSSPIQAKSRRQKATNAYMDEDSGRVSGDDSFMGDDDDDESEPDGFARIREVGTSTRGRRQQLGPPIASDRRLDEANVNDVHRVVIENFVEAAKKLDERLRNEKGRRRHIFTESQLREMAINWATKPSDILAIRGVDLEDAKIFGPSFIPLIRDFHGHYEDMMKPVEGGDLDNAHCITVSLLTDEEDNDEEDADSQDLETTSPFFDPDVRQFNQRVDDAQGKVSAEPQRTTARDKKGKKSASNGKSKGNWKRQSHESSTSGGSTNKVRKRKSGNNRSSNGGPTSGASGTMRQSTIGGRGSGWGSTGGIGMMPT